MHLLISCFSFFIGGSDCCVKLWSAQNACNKDDDDDLMLGLVPHLFCTRAITPFGWM